MNGEFLNAHVNVYYCKWTIDDDVDANNELDFDGDYDKLEAGIYMVVPDEPTHEFNCGFVELMNTA